MDDKAKLEELWNAYQQRLGEEKVRKAVAAAGGRAALVVGTWLLPLVGATLFALAGYLWWTGAGRVPVGAVVAWPVADTVPEGWHVCDGATVDSNSELSVRLRGLYGNLDQSNLVKVKLPDFGGYFLRGAGGASAPMGEPQGDSVGPHTHPVTVSGDIGWAGLGGDDDKDPNGCQNRSATFSGSAASNSGTETRPKNYAVHWIMRIR